MYLRHKHLKSITKTKVAVVSFVLTGLWLVLIFNTIEVFQNIHGVDPLAMINVLFPYFWIILGLFASLCFLSLYLDFDTRWLHLLLLCELSLVLFFTPFFLSGFSWSPDSLWHGGVASYMPEILDGLKPAFSHYAESYPLSFITTYCVEQVSGINVFSYTLYIYPPICIIAMTMLAYVFASRLLSPRKAFISIMLTLPALHFIEPHVSPFSAGTILVLVSFVLLTIEGRIARLLNFFVILTLTLTHPISPISLGIFLVTVGILGIILKGAHACRSPLFGTSFVASNLLFLGIVWFTWTVYYAMSVYKSVGYAILNVVTLNFLSRLEYVSRWTVGGQAFIYSGIHGLNLEVYAIFLLFVSILLISDLSRIRFAWKKKWTTNHAVYDRMTLAFSSIIYAGFGYTLFLTTGQRCLLGRCLIFYILMGSMSISMYLDQRKRTGRGFKELLAVIFVLNLLLSFPIISYSKEAYNTFTPSSGHGLTFVASNIDLSRYSISMGNDQQIAAYVNLSKGVLCPEYPPSNRTSPDFIVLRTNSFFVSAMRYDLSFERNQFTELRDSLNKNMSYRKIYSSPTFEVYCSDEKGHNQLAGFHRESKPSSFWKPFRFSPR